MAFKLREEFPDTTVLLYAVGALFRLRQPFPDVARMAQSCVSQAILREPGAAQKAFALLSFWQMNGTPLDMGLWSRTISHLVLAHEPGGVTSDVAWGLAFCLQTATTLTPAAAKVLSASDDDFVMLQALDMHDRGLLPRGFSLRPVTKQLTDVDLDGEHWFLGYESVRHHFLPTAAGLVAGHRLFSELLRHQVTFYRRTLPGYAMVVHPGGAPDWAVDRWIRDVLDPDRPESGGGAVVEEMRHDVRQLEEPPTSHDEMIRDLLDVLTPKEFIDILAATQGYPG